jgi:hypothetical protein
LTDAPHAKKLFYSPHPSANEHLTIPGLKVYSSKEEKHPDAVARASENSLKIRHQTDGPVWADAPSLGHKVTMK